MNNNFLSRPSLKNLLKTAVITLIAFGIIWGAYQIYTLSGELQKTENSLASSTAAFIDLNSKYKGVLVENKNINAILTDTQKEKLDLEKVKVTNEQKIDVLTKLTTLDPELLRKYSKVFFLSENYIPSPLTGIDTKYLMYPANLLQIHTEVSAYLNALVDAANSSGTDLKVASAYRSFQTQKNLKSTNVITYGSGTANQFVAEQGYSEHQLGTAVDFVTAAHPSVTPGFEKTPAYTWLINNAHQYGFILSYPAGNAYYKYEPWHWRFVGIALARDLHSQGKNFYDLDQRQIDEYLIKIFD